MECAQRGMVEFAPRHTSKLEATYRVLSAEPHVPILCQEEGIVLQATTSHTHAMVYMQGGGDKAACGKLNAVNAGRDV